MSPHFVAPLAQHRHCPLPPRCSILRPPPPRLRPLIRGPTSTVLSPPLLPIPSLASAAGQVPRGRRLLRRHRRRRQRLRPGCQLLDFPWDWRRVAVAALIPCLITPLSTTRFFRYVRVNGNSEFCSSRRAWQVVSRHSAFPFAISLTHRSPSFSLSLSRFSNQAYALLVHNHITRLDQQQQQQANQQAAAAAAVATAAAQFQMTAMQQQQQRSRNSDDVVCGGNVEATKAASSTVVNSGVAVGDAPPNLLHGVIL